MITKVYSGVVIGIESHLVTVETILNLAKHSKFHIVGMGDKAVQESRERIYAALESSGIYLKEHIINVNLAPADLKKNGSLFDFPIAVSLLQILKKISFSDTFLHETLMAGELSFDGSLRRVSGILSLAIDAKKNGKKRIVVPIDNYQEASLIPDIEVIGINSLQDFINYSTTDTWVQAVSKVDTKEIKYSHDFAEVSGQRAAKRMMQVAASGYHNMIMAGPPGSGKTMLARCFSSIMPQLSKDQMIETTRIYSACGDVSLNTLMKAPPFRSPHHSITMPGMVGGGSPPRAGEISLSHNGVLFLDELTEFRRSAIESLRQPMEEGSVMISRAQSSITLPSKFILLAALNPCPCGNSGDMKKSCSCSFLTRYTYLKKISTPFLDRIDLQIFLQAIELKEIADKSNDLSSDKLRETVIKARKIQEKRYNSENVYNGQLSVKQIEKHCVLSDNAKKILDFAFDKFEMSMRSYHKILKVARTIADLAGKDIIEESHIKEALMYRGLEQKLTQLKSRL